MIAEMFGQDCEVVLHDLEKPQNSVVYIVNSHVTGRKVGDSFDRLVPDVILSDKLDQNVVANYYFHTFDGRLIKSSTALISDSNGKVVGAMCVNYDTSKITQQIGWLHNFLPGVDNRPDEFSFANNSDLHVNEIVDNLINDIVDNRDPARQHREERLDMIRFMDQKGIFLMKGSVDKVADLMDVSRVTIYSYIDEIRSQQSEED